MDANFNPYAPPKSEPIPVALPAIHHVRRKGTIWPESLDDWPAWLSAGTLMVLLYASGLGFEFAVAVAFVEVICLAQIFASQSIKVRQGNMVLCFIGFIASFSLSGLAAALWLVFVQ